MRAWAASLAVMLGGCAGGESAQNWSGPSDVEPAPPGFRRVIADHIKTLFPDQTQLGELEISGTRQVDHLKGPAWLTCLRIDAHGHPQNYAIFIQGDKVIDVRSGVVIDQCHKAAYTPFVIETAARKPHP